MGKTFALFWSFATEKELELGSVMPRIWVTISEEAKEFLDKEIAKNASTTTATQ